MDFKAGEGRTLYLVTEWVNKGSLSGFLHNPPQTPMSEEQMSAAAQLRPFSRVTENPLASPPLFEVPDMAALQRIATVRD